MEDLEQKIRRILGKYLPSAESAFKCSTTDNLRELGVTSMQFMSVMRDVEGGLGVRIPMSAMTPGSLETIGAIIRTVSRLMA